MGSEENQEQFNNENQVKLSYTSDLIKISENKLEKYATKAEVNNIESNLKQEVEELKEEWGKNPVQDWIQLNRRLDLFDKLLDRQNQGISTNNKEISDLKDIKSKIVNGIVIFLMVISFIISQFIDLKLISGGN